MTFVVSKSNRVNKSKFSKIYLQIIRSTFITVVCFFSKSDFLNSLNSTASYKSDWDCPSQHSKPLGPSISLLQSLPLIQKFLSCQARSSFIFRSLCIWYLSFLVSWLRWINLVWFTSIYWLFTVRCIQEGGFSRKDLHQTYSWGLRFKSLCHFECQLFLLGLLQACWCPWLRNPLVIGAWSLGCRSDLTRTDGHPLRALSFDLQ